MGPWHEIHHNMEVNISQHASQKFATAKRWLLSWNIRFIWSHKNGFTRESLFAISNHPVLWPEQKYHKSEVSLPSNRNQECETYILTHTTNISQHVVSCVLRPYIHILQGYLTGPGPIVRLSQCQWSNADGCALHLALPNHIKAQQSANGVHIPYDSYRKIFREPWLYFVECICIESGSVTGL